MITHYKSKNITGKRINLLISKEAYEALQKQKRNVKVTRYIENLILNVNEDPKKAQSLFLNQKQMLEKLIGLINFNKKVYLDINATFSNLNQIAYRLNLANLNNDLDQLSKDQHFLLDIKNVLFDTKEELADLKEMLKTLLKDLEKSKGKLHLSLPKQGENNDK